MKKRGIILFILLCTVFGCSKNTGSPSTAYLRFLQAVPAVVVNVELNNNFPLATSVAYDSLTPYTGIDAGAAHIQVNNVSSNSNLINAVVNISPGNYYTFIVADSVNKAIPSLLTDNFIITDTTINIRFLHLSDITGPADVYLVDTTDTLRLFSGRIFNDQYINSSNAQYLSLQPGTYILNISKSFTDTVITSIIDYHYMAGKSYTLLLHNADSISGNHTADVSVVTDN